MRLPHLAVALLLTLALAGCAVPLTDVDRTPQLAHVSAGSVAVAVVDQRRDVGNGRHSPRYDGHNSGIYGIPIPHETASGEPMADHLAGMVAAGLKAKGARPQTVILPVGTPAAKAQAELAARPADRHLLLTLRQWYANIGGVATELSYDVEVVVSDRSGRVLATRTFKAEDEKIPAGKHNLIDAIEVAHRTRLQGILNDYEVAKAL